MIPGLLAALTINSLIHVIVILVIVGILVYLFNLWVPLDGRFKTTINVLIGIVVFLFILKELFGTSLLK